MALHWPTFLTRTGSAVVFAAVMLAGLLWNEWAFLGLVTVIMVLCLRDYFRLSEKTDRVSLISITKGATISCGLCALALTTIYLDNDFLGLNVDHDRPWEIGKGVRTLLLTVFAVLVASVMAALLIRASRVRFDKPSVRPFIALTYIALPCILLVLIRSMHWAWPLILILSIWTNDTMAYIVGSLIGRTPFSPISPKKTWEGTAGGAILTVVGAGTWAFFSEKFPVHEVIGVALCAAVFGTLGDLFESKLKRLAGVKDSGNLMPGHGGALDRFDSLLVATPFAFCYLYFTHL